MLKEFFSLHKKSTETHDISKLDISKQELIIIEGISVNIKKILEKAKEIERKLAKEKDPLLRKSLSEDVLVEYQIAMDYINNAKKNYKKNKNESQWDIYNAQGMRVEERMEYLWGTRKISKEKIQEVA